MRAEATGRKKMAEVHGIRTNAENAWETASAVQSGAESGALFADSSQFEADLQVVVDAWPTLPADLKASIVEIALKVL